MTTQASVPRILLVEDNPADIRLMREVFTECDIRNEVRIARDGQQAMDLLLKPDAESKTYRPDLIILDLNLPKKDGRAVLQEIKNEESLRCIPVIILTTSNNDLDISRAYNLHANCYILKPFDLDRFIDIVQRIEHFWLGIVNLPRNSA